MSSSQQSQPEENSLSLPLDLLDPHLRGRKIISFEEATQIAANDLEDWDHGLQWGGLLLPSSTATTHFCLVGATGSGKTMLIRLLMQSALPLIGKPSKTKPPSPANQANAQAQNTPAPTPPPPNQYVYAAAPEFPYWLFFLALGFAFLMTYPLFFGHESFLTSWIVARIKQKPDYEPGNEIPYMFGWLFISWFLLVVPFITHRSKVSKAKQQWGYVNYLKAEDARKEKEREDQEKVVQKFKDDKAAQAKVEKKKLESDKQRALVYDAKQDVLSFLYGLKNINCRIVVLNPFDKRCSPWDMAEDINSPATALQVASLMIPENKNAAQPFFDNASRHILTSVFIAFIKKAPKKWNFRDVILALHTREHLVALLESVPETRHLVDLYGLDNTSSNNLTGQNIMSSLATFMAPLEFIAAAWSKATEDPVSLNDWIKNEYILVLGNDEEHRMALDTINRVLFKRISELILSQHETETGRTWIFLDEAREAGQLEGLGRLMTKGRSKGASVVLGFQDVEGMRDAYGEKPAHEIIGMCANKVILRVEGPETALWASETFGEFEAFEEKHGWTQGGGFSAGESYQKGKNTSHGTSFTRSRGSSQSPSGYSTNKGTSEGENYSIGESISYGVNSSNSLNWNASINRERMQKAALIPSQFQSLPPTNPQNGLTGFFASPYLGAFDAWLEGDFLEKFKVPLDPNLNEKKRDAADQYLDPWNDSDFQRLSLVIPPPKNNQAQTQSSQSQANTTAQQAQTQPNQGNSTSQNSTPNVNASVGELASALQAQQTKTGFVDPFAGKKGRGK